MKKLFASLAVLISWLCLGATLDGISLPDKIQESGKTLLLNGMGTRKATLFKVKVYVAGLYVEKLSHDPIEILRSPGDKQVDMHFVRDVSAGQLRDAWKENYENNCGANCDALKEKLSALQTLMKDVKDGETMTMIFSQSAVKVLYDAKAAGSIDGAETASIFLLSWLGPKPPNDDLKQGLLGNK